MKWAGRESYLQAFSLEAQVKMLLARPKRRCEDNIQIDLRESVINGVNMILLAQNRVFVKKVMNLRFS
jgi:hypothetical protein